MGKRVKFEISGLHFKTVYLTDEQVKNIVEEYPFQLNRYLIEKYKVSKDLICGIASHYNIKKDFDTYNKLRGRNTTLEPVDTVMFDWFYPKTTDRQLREVFGKSENFIRGLAIERGLNKYPDVRSARQSKDSPKVRYSISGEDFITTEISLQDVKYIVENYPILSDQFIMDRLNCRKGLIVSVAKYYELEKDKKCLSERRKEILVNRNKNITGRDLTPELLQEVALNYHSKREFFDKDASAYTTANRLGIMEEITKHMVNFSFSVPQIITRQITEHLFKEKCEYNTRRIIAPYELDVYFPKLKIAFEYDGKGWHANDELDKTTLCMNLNILLITISERSRRYEEDIKNQLIENLDKINSWGKTNITESDVLSFNDPIDFPKLFTDEELKICRNNDASFLRKNYANLYQKYRRYNPDNKVFSTVKWTLDVVIEEMKKYNSMIDILHNNKQLYQTIHKKFKHLINRNGKPNS